MAATTTTRVRRLGVDADHEHYKWWALSCTSLGMLMATINSGTLIIALPDLERALGTSILALVWVILAYMIASTVLVLTAGRLSDLFGRKTAYVAGFAVFAVASLGAGFAGSGTELILWRIAQGVGGAFLFANSTALVTDAFPREQLGLAMGTNTMVAAVGLVIGPVLGGALVSISWHCQHFQPPWIQNPTRSHTSSTSASWWLESSTVLLCLRSCLIKPFISIVASGSRPMSAHQE